jgi:hypothetical protein
MSDGLIAGGLMLYLVIAVIWSLIPLIICMSLAGKKGKSKGAWFFLSAIFGWIAVLVLAASASEK